MPVNKPRRVGSYAPLSAHYYKDDAIADAGEAAELLYVRGLAFCADVLSDGFISETQLSRFVGVGMKALKARATRLVEVGLWVKVDGGYRVVAWLKWNRSREDISSLNRKDADRKGDSTVPPPVEPPPSEPESERNPNGIRSDSDPPDPLESDWNPASRAPYRTTPLQNHSSSSEADASAPPPQIIVAAWVDASRANGTEPSKAQIGQVGRLAKELLAKNDPGRVLAAAKTAGSRGYATIDRELTAMAGRATPARPPGELPAHTTRDPKTGRAVEH